MHTQGKWIWYWSSYKKAHNHATSCTCIIHTSYFLITIKYPLWELSGVHAIEDLSCWQHSSTILREKLHLGVHLSNLQSLFRDIVMSSLMQGSVNPEASESLHASSKSFDLQLYTIRNGSILLSSTLLFIHAVSILVSAIIINTFSHICNMFGWDILV